MVGKTVSLTHVIVGKGDGPKCSCDGGWAYRYNLSHEDPPVNKQTDTTEDITHGKNITIAS